MFHKFVKKVQPLSIGDNTGKIVSKMYELKIEGLPIFSKDYEGMVYLRDIVVRDLDINTKIKVFIKNVPKLTGGENQRLLDLANKGFKEYNLLPFFIDNHFVGIVSLLDYLSSLDLKIDLDKIAIEPNIVDQNETIGVARNILNKDEVFLVSDENRLVGAVNCFSLAKIISTKRDRIFAPDKQEEKDIKIKDFTEDFVELEKGIEEEDLFRLLKEKGFVVYKNKIITPKIIFRNLSKFEEGTKVEFSGFELAEGVYTEVIYKELNNFAEKVQKIIKPTKIKFHMRKLRKTGKPLYDLDGRIIAGGKIINAKVTGYWLMDLVQELINKLEVQVVKVKH
jgi:ribosome-associated translation inhibitor RaiA